MTDKATRMVPTVHLNGTSREELARQLIAAVNRTAVNEPTTNTCGQASGSRCMQMN